MEQPSNKKDFFISYNHHDEDAARWIAWQLEKGGYTTIIQAWDFLPGNNFVEKMDNALKACKSTIAVLSDHYLQPGFTKAEWQAAFAKDPTGEKRSLIPIRIKSCDLAGILGQIIYIDLVGLKEEEARKKLLESVRSTRLKPGEPPPFKGFETQPVSRLNRDEILKKRETELKELLENTIKHNYHMTLKLEQEIEKEIEIKDEETGEVEKRKELVWEEVELEKILADKNNYILINPSGMGKTTFLTYIACTLLGSNKDYEILPFLTTCIEMNQRKSTIDDFIKSKLESFYYNSQTLLINNEWENLLILIDALDQARDVNDIASSLHLQNTYSNYKKARIFISSRQNTADKIKEGFNKIRLKLPEDDEVQHYLGEKHYSNLKSLIDSSRELITVPVLLEMLKIIAERGHISSKIYNRSTLYNEFTRILIDQERNKPRYWQNPSAINNFINYELEQSLEKIAFLSLANNEILEIGKDKLVKYCDSAEKKDTLLNIGIILELFEERELKLVFRHQSFQAYFAARYIHYQQSRYFKQLLRDIAFFYSDAWYEVLRFYIGLEKNPEKAEKMINSIYQRSYEDEKDDLNNSIRLIFTFFLMSETLVSKEKIDDLYEQLRNLLNKTKGYLLFIESNIDKYNSSNKYQRERINIISEPLLKDKDRYVNGIAVNILDKIKVPSWGSPPLHWHDDWNVQIPKDSRSAKIEALDKVENSKDIPRLKPLLKDYHSYVRKAAAETLGKIGTSKEIPLLEPLLTDSNGYVDRAAAEAIVNICISKDISLIEPLIRHYYEDFHSVVRIAVAEALGKKGTLEVIPILDTLLRDGCSDVRSATVKVLAKIVTPQEIPLLLEPLLKDDASDVRRASAYVIGNIGASKYIPLLTPLFRDDDSFVRRTAVEALGKIGTLHAIPLLKSFIKDRNWEVRRAAVKAIENVYKRLNRGLQIPGRIPGIKAIKFIKYKYRSRKRIHILHLSDVHYSEKKDPDIKVTVYEFIEDLKKWQKQNKEKINIICLTGDIAQSGEVSQYQSIEKRIRDILEATGCTRDDLFIVPGNHDVQEYDKISDKNKEILTLICNNQIDINAQVLNNYENYGDFLNKFNNFYTFLDDYGYNNSKSEKEDHVPKPWYSRKLKGYPIRIIGLNSALFSCKTFKDYGRIGMGTRQLKEAYFKDKTGDDEQIIMLSHHPINWLCEKEHDEFSTLMERYSIIHLHGHTHKIKPRKLFSFSGSYFTIGTGSLYGKKGIDDINTYHILTLDFDKNEITIWARRWIPEQMMWALYSDEINNKFPFPRRTRKAS